MKRVKKIITITHRQTGELIARGSQGWGFMPFEGNYYIRRKYIKTNGFKFSFVPGFCIYKFIYVWLNLKLRNGQKENFIAWMYFIPNPLFPFIWFRIGLPQSHHSLKVEVEKLQINPKS
ncbi:MAG: hypothetical protein Kow0049_26010 [Stanieria sp.]